MTLTTTLRLDEQEKYMIEIAIEVLEQSVLLGELQNLISDKEKIKDGYEFSHQGTTDNILEHLRG